MQFSKTLLATLVLGLSALGNAKIFEATGYGDTVEEARKIAVTNAIKSSVGEFVINREELNDDEFNQKILAHSNAYIKKLEIVSSNKVDSEYEVTVKLDIESQVLLQRLKEAEVVRVKNATRSNELLSELELYDVNENNKNEFLEMVDELIYQPIKDGKKIVDIKVLGKLKPIESDNKQVYVALPIEIGVSKEFGTAFKRLISQVGFEDKRSGGSLGVYELNLSKGQIGVDRNEMSPKHHIPYKSGEEFSGNWIANIKNLSKHSKNSAFGKIELVLLDEQDEELRKYDFREFNEFLNHSTTLKMQYDGGKLDGKIFHIKNLLPVCNGYIYCSYSTGKARVRLIFPIDREMISDIKDIQLRFRY